MTYIERIIYLNGQFIQVSQYCLLNAYRVINLYKLTQEIDPTLNKLDALEILEKKSRQQLKENINKSSLELIDFFTGKGLSVKQFKKLKEILLKRDYQSNYFFIDNASLLAREEIAIYNSKIQELSENYSLAKELNISLIETAKKVQDAILYSKKVI